MTQQEQRTYLVTAITRLGGGYDPDLLILAGMLIQAADNQRNRTGPYLTAIQQGLQQFEELALAKQIQRRQRDEIFRDDEMDDVPFVFTANNPDQEDVYRIFKEFDLHRLSPTFKSESLNESIRKAQAAHTPKPKGFWDSLFG